MKKIFSFFLIGLMVISFSSCSNGQDKYGSEIKKLRENSSAVMDDWFTSSVHYTQGDEDALVDVSNQVDKFLEISKKMKKLTPPDSVKELHDNMVVSFDNFVTILREETDQRKAGNNVSITNGESDFSNFVQYQQEIFKILGIEWIITK